MKPSAITIRDVARCAKVHPSTVSKVLHGYAGIAEPTRKKVLREVRRLEFQPQQLKRAFSFALCLAPPGELQQSPLLNSYQIMISDELTRMGHRVRRCYWDKRISVNSLRQRLGSRELHGVAAIGVYDVPFLKRCRELTPTVVVDWVYPSLVDGGVDFIEVDGFRGSLNAIEYLIELGHRSIGMIVNDPLREIGFSRYSTDAYRYAHLKAGIREDLSLIVRGDATPAGGHAGAQQLLTRPNRVTALYLHEGGLPGAMRSIGESGLRVPQDISLVTWGGSKEFEALLPGISTVRVPLDSVAKLTTARLLDAVWLQDRHVPCSCIIRPVFVPGSTSCPPPK